MLLKKFKVVLPSLFFIPRYASKFLKNYENKLQAGYFHNQTATDKENSDHDDDYTDFDDFYSDTNYDYYQPKNDDFRTTGFSKDTFDPFSDVKPNFPHPNPKNLKSIKEYFDYEKNLGVDLSQPELGLNHDSHVKPIFKVDIELKMLEKLTTESIDIAKNAYINRHTCGLLYAGNLISNKAIDRISPLYSQTGELNYPGRAENSTLYPIYARADSGIILDYRIVEFIGKNFRAWKARQFQLSQNRKKRFVPSFEDMDEKFLSLFEEGEEGSGSGSELESLQNLGLDDDRQIEVVDENPNEQNAETQPISLKLEKETSPFPCYTNPDISLGIWINDLQNNQNFIDKVFSQSNKTTSNVINYYHNPYKFRHITNSNVPISKKIKSMFYQKSEEIKELSERHLPLSIGSIAGDPQIWWESHIVLLRAFDSLYQSYMGNI